MSRVHTTYKKMSVKKKIAALGAILLSFAMLIGGALAFADFSQSIANRFHGSSGNPDILLHDDFENGINKDVYVENTGETPMVVRVQFAEYLQVGNTPIVGENSRDKSTWEVRTFNTAPANDGALPSQNYHIWYMTGNGKIFKPGTNEMGNYDYSLGQTFEDGAVAKNTLGASPVILIANYLADKANLDSLYPDGMWVLDVDGWCYWTKALQKGESTNLLLDNVILDPDNHPDDNYYYAIDVRLQATNFTESYLLYNGSDSVNDPSDPDYSKYDPQGEEATEEGIEVIRDIVKETPAPLVVDVKIYDRRERLIENGATVKRNQSSSEKEENFTAIVEGENLNDGGVIWSIESQEPDGGVTIDQTGKITIPANYEGTIVIRATSKDDPSKYSEFTMLVEELDLDETPTEVTGRTLDDSQTGDGTWIEIARNGKFSLIYRAECIEADINYGSTFNYQGSKVQNAINSWFINNDDDSDKLAWDARIREFTVENTCMSSIGTADASNVGTDGFGVFDGYSAPTGDMNEGLPAAAGGTGTANIAFALSNGEASRFCSLQWLYTGTPPQGYLQSNAIARANWAQLTDGSTSNSWLRTAFFTTDYACILFSDGSVHALSVSNTSTRNSVRPAVWVDSEIFN